MTTPSVSVTTQKIALALIDPPAWNSRIVKTGAALRLEQSKIEDLAHSLESEGQLTPIEVEEKENGRYELVFGSRRVRAATALKWTEINATVRPQSSASERILRNIIENEQRENLTTFEQARSYKQLRELGLSNPDISTKLGKSATHISNLYGQITKLPEPILKEWESQNPVASFANLTALASDKDYPKAEDKVRAWDVLVSEASARAASGGGKAGKRGKGKKGSNGASAAKPYNAIRAHVDAIINQFGGRSKADEKVNATHKWVYDLVMWTVGVRKTPPEGVELPQK